MTRRDPIPSWKLAEFRKTGEYAAGTTHKGKSLYRERGIDPANARSAWFRYYPDNPPIIDDRLRAAFRKGYRDEWARHEADEQPLEIVIHDPQAESE